MRVGNARLLMPARPQTKKTSARSGSGRQEGVISLSHGNLLWTWGKRAASLRGADEVRQGCVRRPAYFCDSENGPRSTHQCAKTRRTVGQIAMKHIRWPHPQRPRVGPQMLVNRHSLACFRMSGRTQFAVKKTAFVVLVGGKLACFGFGHDRRPAKVKTRIMAAAARRRKHGLYVAS